MGSGRTAFAGVMAICALTARAQVVTPRAEGEPLAAGPAPAPVPETPRIARAMARSWTREILVRRYEMDAAKLDEATEIIARHLMRTAHQLDTPEGQAMKEAFLTGLIEMRTNVMASKGGPSVPPELGREIGQRMQPALPILRQLFADATRDIRPMLATKQQLKLAADMIIVNSVFDFMDTTMQEWARGQIDPQDNPLDPYWGNMKYADNPDGGRSAKMDAVRKWSAQAAPDGKWASWQDYVKQAKELYAFDDAQSATADSILRECIERGGAIGANKSFGERLVQNRLWYYAAVYPKDWRWEHPVVYLLQAEYEDLWAPLAALEEELQRRIDRIPTEPQRQAATERLKQKLSETQIKVLDW